jgi:hypothetical protein
MAPTEVINVKPQACSCGQAECPDTKPYHTHEVIERPEIPMTVSPPFLGTLLPLQVDGVLVRDARVRWQMPHPWSLWQALMILEDRASCCREAFRTLGPRGKARAPRALRPPRCGALDPLAAVPRRVSSIRPGWPPLLTPRPPARAAGRDPPDARLAQPPHSSPPSPRPGAGTPPIARS